ncbi:BQ2448_7904 [Microbotryum intermedium]|uniref:BQ2448_7904 protein n=1 Tax=Microbotryum intermedium TaxID=269621 RepID=A0A238FNW8_9BASI|nr:BQ2448_7904 [Microbotryum intermedium]
MRSFSVLAAAALVVSVAAAPNTGSSTQLKPVSDARVCGTTKTPDVAAEKFIAAKIAALEARIASVRGTGAATSRQAAIAAVVATKNVPVYFHVIQNATGTSTRNGYISAATINSQISVLNQGFANSGVSFSLAGSDYTVNRNWFTYAGPSTTQQTAMKSALRKGNAASLNLYRQACSRFGSPVGFVEGSGKGLLGYATFPESYRGAPKDDGVVFLYSSVPGGATENYNQGKTVTHEVGHWVGLYHTFQGGCTGNGDFVDDTPAEASPATGCDRGRDTCSSAGTDPVTNFMDYSYDACMDNFTSGQSTRLISQLETYRGL